MFTFAFGSLDDKHPCEKKVSWSPQWTNTQGTLPPPPPLEIEKIWTTDAAPTLSSGAASLSTRGRDLFLHQKRITLYKALMDAPEETSRSTALVELQQHQVMEEDNHPSMSEDAIQDASSYVFMLSQVESQQNKTTPQHFLLSGHTRDAVIAREYLVNNPIGWREYYKSFGVDPDAHPWVRMYEQYIQQAWDRWGLILFSPQDGPLAGQYELALPVFQQLTAYMGKLHRAFCVREALARHGIGLVVETHKSSGDSMIGYYRSHWRTLAILEPDKNKPNNTLTHALLEALDFHTGFGQRASSADKNVREFIRASQEWNLIVPDKSTGIHPLHFTPEHKMQQHYKQRMDGLHNNDAPRRCLARLFEELLSPVLGVPLHYDRQDGYWGFSYIIQHIEAISSLANLLGIEFHRQYIDHLRHIFIPQNNDPLAIDNVNKGRRALDARQYDHGLRISIETSQGNTRSGESPQGKSWSTTMPADYGYIRGTLGIAPDGDHLDVFLGNEESPKKVWVFHVVDPHTDDEPYDDKVALNFPSKQQAIGAFRRMYDTPDRYLPDGETKGITEWSLEEFKFLMQALVRSKILKPRKLDKKYQSEIQKEMKS